MIKNSILILLLATTTTYAQYYKTYDWKTDPVLSTITDKEADESSVGILKKHVVEYAKSTFGQSLRIFETTHTITRVNDERGIDRHNTVYIPMYSVKEIIDIKARTINPDGKITILDKDHIKEMNNVEEYGDFKVFAISGAEANSEIEMLYTVEKDYDLHGTQILQADYPIKSAEFLYITNELDSKIKAYRTEEGFETTDIDGKQAQRLILSNIPAMLEEEYATPNANKIEVVYQCYPEDQNITQEMFWNNIVNNVGGQFFPENVNELVRNDIPNVLKDHQDLTTFQMATLLDEYMKTNFNIVKNNNPELSDLDQILKNRNTSDFGILKAYGHYLKALNIEYEIVITSNRFTHKFDPEFFNPNMLRDFLIYLPGEKKYLSPNSIEYRLGEAPYNILGNYGLYITKSFEYYFSKIIQNDIEYSKINRISNISFDEDVENVKIDQYQEYTGHWSATNRAVLALSTEEGKRQFEDYLTSSGIEDKVVLNYETRNNELMQFDYNIPFVVECSITSESLLEEAGDSYIFQIGKVIGTQSELYQETERVNPIEMTYPNQYDYKITIHIPDGYTADGLDVLNIDKSYRSVKGDKLCKFESSYEIIDNKVVITIQEYYKSNEYDLNRYDEFREVINAASDFNKASILLKATE